MKHAAILGWAVLLGLACARAPYQEPFSALVLKPRPGQAVVVDQTVILLDSSGSIDGGNGWPADKALLESYVAGMPEGRYRAGSINFGGKTLDKAPLRSFDRSALASHARAARYLGNGTPLERVLRDVADDLAGGGGRAAVVLLTDGVPTIAGTPRTGDAELEAAKELVERHGGTVCFHAVQTGTTARGREFLEKLTQSTDCGSLRDASAVVRASDLLVFQREVFIGIDPAMITDTDGDGVFDIDDQCAGTPGGARVDARGCWVLTDLRFGRDSTTIDPTRLDEVDDIAAVLERNPGLRIGVDGHADDTGSPDYNQRLSERRAAAVRDRLVGLGIRASRLEVRGFGESRPAAPNATEAGRLLNRRIEFSVLRGSPPAAPSD